MMLEEHIPFLFTAAVLVAVILLSKRQAIRSATAQHERNMAAIDAQMAESTAWSEAELAKTRAALAKPIEGEFDRAEDDEPLPPDEDPDVESRLSPSLRPADPTDDITDDEREFLSALAEYQERSGRQPPSWREALVVLKQLGYQKRLPSDPAPR